eukprot:scaffold932_cov139-Skeletonema_menzelii.AAC.11
MEVELLFGGYYIPEVIMRQLKTVLSLKRASIVCCQWRQGVHERCCALHLHFIFQLGPLKFYLCAMDGSSSLDGDRCSNE